LRNHVLQSTHPSRTTWRQMPREMCAAQNGGAAKPQEQASCCRKAHPACLSSSQDEWLPTDGPLRWELLVQLLRFVLPTGYLEISALGKADPTLGSTMGAICGKALPAADHPPDYERLEIREWHARLSDIAYGAGI
jgi:hypothetical protein